MGRNLGFTFQTPKRKANNYHDDTLYRSTSHPVAVAPGGVIHDIPNQMHYDGTGPEGATLEFIAMVHGEEPGKCTDNS